MRELAVRPPLQFREMHYAAAGADDAYAAASILTTVFTIVTAAAGSASEQTYLLTLNEKMSIRCHNIRHFGKVPILRDVVTSLVVDSIMHGSDSQPPS